VLEVRLTNDSFIRRDDVDPETYFENAWEVYSGEPVEVVVRFTGAAARVVLSATHHPGESLEKTGENEVLYTVASRGLEEIQRWILGFGTDAEVVAPSELRCNLGLIGRYLNSAYNS